MECKRAEMVDVTTDWKQHWSKTLLCLCLKCLQKNYAFSRLLNFIAAILLNSRWSGARCETKRTISSLSPWGLCHFQGQRQKNFLQAMPPYRNVWVPSQSERGHFMRTALRSNRAKLQKKERNQRIAPPLPS